MTESSVAGIAGDSPQRHDDDQEDQRHAGEQDRQRELVRRLLALGAFDERDHAVDEGVAGRGGDLHLDPVGENGRAAGHRRAVAARFADDRCRFAGDRRFIDRGDAFDDLAIGRDDLAGLDDDDVAHAQIERRDLLEEIVALVGLQQAARHRVRAGPAQGIGLRLAAALGHRFGEIGEQHGEPQPGGDLAGKQRGAVAGQRSRAATVRSPAPPPTAVTKITGLRAKQARIELDEGIACAASTAIALSKSEGLAFLG